MNWSIELFSGLMLWIAFTIQANAWNPGSRVEGWPHVRMGESEGIYVPDEGWRFSDDYPDDLSTAILNENGVVLSNSSTGSIHIPAPEGYWTPTPGTGLETICKIWARNHTEEPLIHMWVRIDARYGLLVASICEFSELHGETVSLADFRTIKKMWQDEIPKSKLQEGYLATWVAD